MKAKSRQGGWGGAGCGFLLRACLVTCLFLVINSVLVSSLYAWYKPSGPPIMKKNEFAQTIMFAVPVLLVFVEWWLVDFLYDRLSLRRQPDESDQAK